MQAEPIFRRLLCRKFHGGCAHIRWVLHKSLLRWLILTLTTHFGTHLVRLVIAKANACLSVCIRLYRRRGGYFLAARRYFSMVYAVDVCMSVCPSDGLSQVGVSSGKRSITQTTPHDNQGIVSKTVKYLGEIRTGSSPTGSSNAGGVG